MTLEELQRAFTAIPEPESEPESAESMDPDHIWAAVRGELDPEQTLEIVDQLHRDPQLALEWRLAHALAQESGTGLDSGDPSAREPESDSKPAQPAANDRRYWVSLSAFAAAAAVVAVLVVNNGGEEESLTELPLVETGSEDASYRAAPRAAIASELTLSELPRDHFELRWTDVPGATRYELRVTTRGLEVIHEDQEITAAHVQVPATALAQIEAETELIWHVIAVMPDGEHRRSDALTIRVR